MDLEGGWVGMDWIYLAHYRGEWNVVVVKIMVRLLL
jgi:hypothetical protein